MNGSLTLLDDNLLYIAFSIIGLSSKNDQKMKFRGRGRGPMAQSLPEPKRSEKRNPWPQKMKFWSRKKRKLQKKLHPYGVHISVYDLQTHVGGRHPVLYSGSREILGYPGIPGFVQNSDPGVLKNLILGFFGISRSP